MARMNVILADPVLAELRRLIPARRRSEFVTDAIRDKLTLLQQEAAVRAAAGIWSSEGRDEPELELRALRSSWARREALRDEPK